ncbi:MAG: hypothetical protein KU38_02330 [Sulfurovum sp. FS08-3]|nr:MAG: hypothetical protein KU38_02330 [Sulfurovum sp. FS08-3]
MKAKIIFYWMLIGLVISPFHYASGGYKYRIDRTRASFIGSAYGEALRWPFYFLMSSTARGNSEVDGTDNKSIELSLVRIVLERVAWEDINAGEVLLESIGQCFLSEYRKSFNGSKPDINWLKVDISTPLTPQEEQIRDKLLKELNGNDFADIVKKGAKCRYENYKASKSDDS